jgi:hypothetical protein
MGGKVESLETSSNGIEDEVNIVIANEVFFNDN